MSVSRVIIVHGTGGSPDENWFPWLRDELAGTGVSVVVPQFSGPDSQSPSDWLATLGDVTPPLAEDCVLVGHSIGAALIVRALEASGSPVAGTVLASGFVGALGNDFDKPNAPFFATPIDWPAVRRNAGHVRLFFGEDDPYVPRETADALAAGIGSNLTLIPNGGHLNKAAGFTSFPLLLGAIREIAAAS